MLCGRENQEKFGFLWLIEATGRFRGRNSSVINNSMGGRRQDVLDYRETDHGLVLMKNSDDKPESHCMNVLAIVDVALQRSMQGLRCTAQAQRRFAYEPAQAKQGRPPLIYDWHTVELPAINIA